MVASSSSSSNSKKMNEAAVDIDGAAGGATSILKSAESLLSSSLSGGNIKDLATKKLESMRSRELRNFLIQKVGFKKVDIDKILDLKELRLIAEDYKDKLLETLTTPNAIVGGDVTGTDAAAAAAPADIGQDILYLVQLALSKIGILLAIVFSLMVIIYILARFSFIKTIYSYLDQEASTRLDILRRSIRHRWIKTSIYFSLTSALSLYVFLLRVRVLFSWTPYVVLNNVPALNNLLRLLYLLPCFSFALPTNLGSSQNSMLNNIDLGPLVFQYLIHKIREKLDVRGFDIYRADSEKLAADKSEMKEQKKAKNSSKERQQNKSSQSEISSQNDKQEENELKKEKEDYSNIADLD